MAVDATARLYDVDEDTVVFKKHGKTEKYDQATVTFRARAGKLIDLDKLHESLWATRLSGGTRSGLVSLDVTAIGRVVETANGTILRISDSDAEFVLGPHTDEAHAAEFGKLKTANGANQLFRVSGLIDNYRGRWPDVLKTTPARPRRILVTAFEVVEEK